MSYYKVYGREFSFVMGCTFISSMAGLLVPLCVRRVTELAAEGKEVVSTILSSGALMLVLVLVQLVFEFLFDVRGHVLGARMEQDLRTELFSHLEKLPFSFYDKHKTGVLMSALTNDLLNLAELFHHGPEDYIMTAVKVLGATVILFTMEWRLALVTLFFMVLLLLFTLLWAKKLRKVYGVNQERIAGINARAGDILGGIRTVQSYTAEESQLKRFVKAGEDFFKSRKQVYYQESYADKTTFLLVQGCTVAVMVCGAVMLYTGDLTAAELVAFLLYIRYFTEPISRMSWMVEQLQTGMAGFDRVMDLLETPVAFPEAVFQEDCREDLPKGASAAPLALTKGDICFEGVDFSYVEGNPVLKDLSLHIADGSFTALVGVSGSGKSTLGMLIPRYYEVTGGRILIDGTDIRQMDPEGLRRSIAWVEQDTFLMDGTIRENIALGNPDALDDAILRAARLADAEEFISALPDGYDSLVGERGVRLSGGQKQRIGIARAILK
ncbi:MAG: ABC transporter ATP-binding protein, partial [Lachnospiraceae bacterium]|nr:ABC transporter ATP-binding protein [Lachnospiraceae bacterium]